MGRSPSDQHSPAFASLPVDTLVVPAPPVSFPKPIDGSHVLAKASEDCWEYVIGLKSGLIVHCTDVELRGDWLLINGIQRAELANGSEPLVGRFFWGRGLETRTSEVAWCADCDS